MANKKEEVDRMLKEFETQYLQSKTTEAQVKILMLISTFHDSVLSIAGLTMYRWDCKATMMRMNPNFTEGYFKSSKKSKKNEARAIE